MSTGSHSLLRSLVFGCALAAAAWPACRSLAASDSPVPDVEAGKAAYTQHCARCHGLLGKGDGVDAKRFYPRPRDFSLGVYKFRSTASGTPPSDEDVFRTITQGLPGTNMPDWKHLDDATRWQLVYYLKSLSPAFQTAATPVTVAPDPGAKRADVEKGKAVYQQLGCAACHGALGRANGTSAAGLVDDWNMPIRPADLTQGWSYRGGREPRDIMLRMLTGIDGAGMPSYAEAVSPEDAWQLAYYVASLQEPVSWNMLVHPLQMDGELPSSPTDPRWESAEPTDVRLRNAVTPEGEWAAPPTVKAIAFRAVYNEEAIALRFSWDDPTQDTQQDSPDGFALVLKPDGAQGDVVTLQAWPYAESPALDVCYWAANSAGPVETLATDYDQVRAGRSSGGSLRSAAHYEDGRWQLVIQRALKPAMPEGLAAVAPEGFTSLAFVVWDGGNPSARAVSPWLELAPSRLSAQAAGRAAHRAAH